MKGKKMKFTTKGAVAVTAALALGLTAACQPGGNTGNQPSESPSQVTNTELANTAAMINEQPRDNIKDGGTLTTATTEISPQFNTFQADGTRYTLDLWKWYNPVLALYSPDGEQTWNPDYLTDVKAETVDGNTVVTYTIRPEAKFNDGTEIDWTAFEATWKSSSGKDEKYLVSSTDGYDKIKSVAQGKDAKQAVITWDGAWPWWRGQFNFILHPKAAASPEVFNEGYLNNPHAEWGAGPYTVKSFDEKAGTIVFERNPKWWGDTGKLDERIFRALEDQADINAFKNNETDATGVGNKDRLAQVKDMKDIEIRQSATPSNSLLTLNGKSEILSDVKVRQAIFKAVDRETFLQVRYNGMNYTEDLPGSFMMFPWQKGYEDNVKAAGIGFDKAGAEALLDEAGWTKGSDGIREKAGKKLSLVYPVLGDSPTGKAMAAALQKMMKDVGVDLQIKNRPSGDFSAVITKRDFDFFLMGFASSDPYGQAYFCQIYCSNSELNLSSTGTEDLDKKIAEATKIADPDEQTAALNKLEVEAFGLAGILPLYNGPTMIAVKKGLANYGAGLFYVGKPQDIGWQK